MSEARTWLDGHARTAGFDDRAVAELELALTEALSNVIRHSYHGVEDEPIVLSARIDDDRLTVTVRDIGAKFDRATVPPVELDIPHIGGYGVYFIEAVMDEVEWDTSPEQGTVLRMVRLRPGATPS